jgi:membrane fusion protein (multidrug efflux system)
VTRAGGQPTQLDAALPLTAEEGERQATDGRSLDDGTDPSRRSRADRHRRERPGRNRPNRDDDKDDGRTRIPQPHPDRKNSTTDQDQSKREGGNQGGGRDGKRTAWPLIALIVGLILALIAGVTYWYLTKDQVSTDDAYTDGRSVAIAPRADCPDRSGRGQFLS